MNLQTVEEHSAELLSPSEWLTQEKLDKITEQLAEQKKIMILSGAITKILNYWISREIYHDSILSGKFVPTSEYIDETSAISASGVNTETKLQPLRLQLRREYNRALYEWAYNFWKDSVNTLYIKHRSSLARVKFAMITSAKKNMLNEVFHQVRNEEISLESEALFRATQISSCKLKNFDLVNISALHPQIQNQIKVFASKKISRPFAFENGYTFIVIKQIIEPSLNEDIERQVIKMELTEWMNNAVARILNHL